MGTRKWMWAVLGVVVLVVIGSTLVVLNRTPTTPPVSAPSPPVPKAIVALGDSEVSGEGAGSYVDGTDGQRGNFCHRSAAAEVLKTSIAYYPWHYDLACSGALAADLTHPGQFGEPAQTARLAAIAKQHPIGAVVVTAGANDDPGFASQIARCVGVFILGFSCTEGYEGQWRTKVNAMVPKLTAALRGVRATMRAAGYHDDAYKLIVQSYASPLGPGVPPQLQDLNACPFGNNDLAWFSGTGVGVLDAGMRRSAAAVGAHYLDMSRAGRGHEACVGDKEWFNRLMVNWQDVESAARSGHSVSASFHPNAAGHEQFAGCLSAFVTDDRRTASCTVGPDGNLHENPAVQHG